MNWNSWSDFLHMGGYGLYVWGTFAVTAVTFLGEILSLRAHRRSGLQELDDDEE
jgi:heme exporter protein D